MFFKMNFIGISTLFAIGILLIIVPTTESMPVETGTFYNLLSNLECPVLKQTIFINPHPYLDKCNVTEALLAKNISIDTHRNALCLLYYNNVLNLCNLSSTAKVALPVLDFNQSKIDAIEKSDIFCSELKINPSLSNTVLMEIYSKDKNRCNRVCRDYNDNPLPICGLAYYLFSFTNQIQTIITEKPVIKEPQISFNEIKTDVKPEVKAPVLPKADTEIQEEKPNNLDVFPKADQNLEESKVKETTVSQKIIKSPVPTHDVTQKIDKPGQVSEKDGVFPKVDDSMNPKPEVVSKGVYPKDQPQLSEENAKDEEHTQAKDKSEEIIINDNSQTEKVQPENVKSEEKIITPSSTAATAQQQHYEMYEDDDDINLKQNIKEEFTAKQPVKPFNTEDEGMATVSEMDGDSYFFSYFMMLCVVFVLGYVGYHNKQKILAIMVEGRRGRRPSRARRPNSANYHKLDSNLEEAVTSGCNKSSSQIIY